MQKVEGFLFCGERSRARSRRATGLAKRGRCVESRDRAGKKGGMVKQEADLSRLGLAQPPCPEGIEMGLGVEGQAEPFFRGGRGLKLLGLDKQKILVGEGEDLKQIGPGLGKFGGPRLRRRDGERGTSVRPRLPRFPERSVWKAGSEGGFLKLFKKACRFFEVRF